MTEIFLYDLGFFPSFNRLYKKKKLLKKFIYLILVHIMKKFIISVAMHRKNINIHFLLTLDLNYLSILLLFKKHYLKYNKKINVYKKISTKCN